MLPVSNDNIRDLVCLKAILALLIYKFFKTYLYVYILTIKIQLHTHEKEGNKHTPVSQDKRTGEKFFF